MRLRPGLTLSRYLLTILFSISFYGNAVATDITWNGSTSDDWFTAANWDGNVTPGSTDTAIIAGSTDSVQFGAPVLINSLGMSDGMLTGNATTFDAGGFSNFQGGAIGGSSDYTFGTDSGDSTGLSWSNGIMTSTGTVTVFDTFLWSGGTLDLSGTETKGTLLVNVANGGVTGDVTWVSGDIAGEGLAIADGSQVTVTGTKTRNLRGTGLQNAGALVFNDTPDVEVGDSSSGTSILNTSTGSIEFNGATTIKDASTTKTSTIFNQGKITNSTGTGETVIETNLVQTGNGTITVESGSLALTNGGSFGTGTRTTVGSFDILFPTVTASGPRLEFRGGDYSFDDGATLSNIDSSGEIALSGGANVQIAGTLNNSGNTKLTGGSTLTLTNSTAKSHFLSMDDGESTILNTGTHTIQGGELTGGTLAGFSNDLDLTTVNPPTIAGPSPVTFGQTILEKGVETTNTLMINSGDGVLIQDHEFINNDQVVQSSSTLHQSNSKITNNGSWSMSDSSITSDSVSVFDNNGSLQINNVEIGSSMASYYNSTGGSLYVEEGNFELSGSGTIDEFSNVTVGDVESGNYGALTFNGGDYTFAGNNTNYSTIDGTDNSRIELNNATVTTSGTLDTSGTLVVDNGSTLTINSLPNAGVASVGNLQLGSSPDLLLTAVDDSPSTYSTINGKGTLQIQNGTWSEGEIAGDGQEFGPFVVTGSLNVPVINGNFSGGLNSYYYGSGSLVITGSGSKLLSNRTMENFGNVYQDASTLQLSGAAIENYGQWELSTGSYISDSGESVFRNFGEVITYNNLIPNSAIVAPPYIGGVTITPDFINSGRVYVNTDTLIFDGAYTQEANVMEIEGGPISVNEDQETGITNGGTIIFNQGATFTSGRIIGDGSIEGDLTVSNTEIEPYSSFFTDASVSSDFSAQNAILGYGGILNFDGNVTLDSMAQATLKILGPSTGEFDQITTTGTFNINNATLNIESPNDVASLLTSSDFFPIFEAFDGGQFVGLFAGLTDGSLVDIYDLDGNLLGQFNIFYNDFDISLTNFQPVPEPQTYALLAIGLGIVAWSVRRKRNQAS